MEVHRLLGCGFLEAVYQEALGRELESRGIPFEREVELSISYKGELLAAKYNADFVCYEAVVVELKAVSAIGRVEEAQVINYLKAANLETGLLLNFAKERLEYRRFVRTTSATSATSAVREKSEVSV